ncbi:MAG: hypothetical protein ABFD49_04270 [Armatimonadota bacterium]|nr:hypothetical protein [bacterium]
MRIGRCFALAVWWVIAINCSVANCAQTVKGTLVSVASDSISFVLQIGNSTSGFAVTSDVKVMRGQIGKESRAVKLRDLAEGDHIVAVVNQNGFASSVKGFFGVMIGTAVGVNDNKLTLTDGRSVTLSPGALVVLYDGRAGQPSDIKKGMLVKCRVNPISAQAWTIFAARPDKDDSSAQPKTVPPAKPDAKQIAKTIAKPVPASPEKPKIQSVTYSAPSPLKAGDLLTVDVSGTVGCQATFTVNNLIKDTRMDEVSPGSYRAVIEIPRDKAVRSAALTAKLVVNGVSSAAVQAARLVTVESAPPVQSPSNTETAAVAKPALAIVPVVEAVAAQTQEVAHSKIVLTNPPDGAKITRALLVRGTADPDSKVLVTITYTNGLTGLLKLAGEVASQMVAVGDNGEFRMGPIALEGPLATAGLEFTIKAYYPDREDHGTAVVKATGARS